jgi:hypothetical protein
MRLIPIKFLFTCLFNFLIANYALGQIESIPDKLITIQPLSFDFYKLQESLLQDLPFRSEVVSGCICDPVFPRIVGISILGGFQKPNYGIGLVADPLIWRYIKGELYYRSEFQNEYTLNSLIKTDIPRLPAFLIEYKNYNVSNESLNKYERISLVIEQQQSWLSFGLLLGYENYQDNERIGFGASFRYSFNKKIDSCCPKYISYGNLTMKVNIFGNTLNYVLGYDYLFKIPIRVHIQYERLYNYNDFQMSLEYLIFY